MSRPSAAKTAELNLAATRTSPGSGSRQGRWWPGRPRSVSDVLYLVAFVVLLGSCVLRFVFWARARSLWLDEEMLAGNLRSRDFGGLTGALSDGQAAPLGWLWLERAMVGIFGYGEQALRLVPMLFGVGGVILAYAFGRRRLNGAGTLALVTLVSFNAANLNYGDQVKHYSADMFWALLLIAAAFWLLDDLGSPRRWVTWWSLAAVGSWLSLGAILSTPALALVVIVSAWRRRGPRGILLGVLPGVVWLGSLGVNYLISLRFVAGSTYLTSFWEGLGYPPSGSGLLGIAKWFAKHIPLVLTDTIPLTFGLAARWVAAVLVVVLGVLCVVGVVVGLRRRVEYGLVIIAAPVSAALLALLHKAPLSGRLALWMVPALLVAVAFAVDAAATAVMPAAACSATRRVPGEQGRRLLASGQGRRLVDSVPVRWLGSVRARRVAAGGVLVLSLALVASAAIVLPAMFTEPTLDDRAAIAALVADHRPGDLTLFVGSAIEAQHWYDPDLGLAPVRGLYFTPAGPNCDSAAFSNAVAGYQRVVVYAGVRFTGYSDPEAVIPGQLARVGQIVRTSHFGTYGIVWVADLTHPATAPGITAPADRCLVVA
jgi:hypothetical protein